MTDLFRFAPWFGMALLLATLVLLEAGRRIGAARIAADPDGAAAGVSAVEAAVFALLGLLIAFTSRGQPSASMRAVSSSSRKRMQYARRGCDLTYCRGTSSPPCASCCANTSTPAWRLIRSSPMPLHPQPRTHDRSSFCLQLWQQGVGISNSSGSHLGHGTVTARAHRPIRSQVDPRNGCAHPSAGNRLRDARRADPDGGSSATTWRVARRAIGCTSSASRS